MKGWRVFSPGAHVDESEEVRAGIEQNQQRNDLQRDRFQIACDSVSRTERGLPSKLNSCRDSMNRLLPPPLRSPLG